MSILDDREMFRLEAQENCLRLGADKQLFNLSRQLISEAEKYRYTYLWSWLGMPIIQLPADIVALQEVVWSSKPDIIVETGVARGGSLVFFASMLTLIGQGKVIGVDIDIRAHNRDAIESHSLANRIVLIEGSSISAETVNRVKKHIPENAKVMVVLDSDHSRQHVLQELEVYAPLVSEGHYLIVADTILGHFTEEQTPIARSKVWYPGNEPYSALCDFLKNNTDFEPEPEINGKLIVASSPGGYLRRRQH
jgi:cephalosporin hydroxylase